MTETVEARLTAQDKGLTETLERVGNALRSLEATMKQIGDVIIKAQDKATPQIKKAIDAVQSVPTEKQTALEAADHVTPAAEQAADTLDAVPAEKQTALEAADHITPEAEEASDALDSIPPEKASALEAYDHITQAAHQAADALSSITQQVTVALNANNTIPEEGGKAEDALRGVQDEAEKTQSALQNAFSFGAGSALGGKALEMVSAGFKGLTTDAVQVGTNFEASMSKVAAIMGDSLSEYKAGPEAAYTALETAAKNAGATTQFSASQAADALQYMALAGWKVDQSVETLPAILNLAAAADMDLAKASDTVTDYMSAFSNSCMQSRGEMEKVPLSAERMVDIMAYAQANSNTSADQLGEAWKNCAANLNAAGQDVQTVTSMLEAMANQGLKGSEAGTALAAIMRDITNSMENGAIKIGETSVAVQDEYGNFLDLTEILTNVEKATDGMGDAQRAAALSATFTADSQKGVNLLFNEGMEKVAGYEEALNNCKDAASKAAETMNDNLAGDLKTLGSAWEAVQVTMSGLFIPSLREVVQVGTEVLQWMNQLISGFSDWKAVMSGDATKEQTEAYAQLSGTMKSLYEIFDKVKQAWDNFVQGFAQSGALDAIKQTIVTCKQTFLQLAGAMSGDAAAGAQTFGEALGSVVKLVAQAVEKIASFESSTGGLIGKLVAGAAGFKLFGGAATSIFGKVSGVFSGIKGLFSGGFPNPFKKTAKDANEGMDGASKAANSGMSKIAQIIKSIGDSIGSAFKGVGQMIGSMNIQGALSFAVAVAAVTAAFLALAACQDIVLPFLEGIQQILSDLIANVLSSLASFLVTISPILLTIAEALVMLSPLVTAIGEAVATIVTAVGEALAGLVEALTPVVQIIADAIVQIIAALAPYLPEVTKIVQATSEAIQAICVAFSQLVAQIGPIIEALAQLISTVFEGINTTIKTVCEGASQVLESFGTTCESVGTAIKTAFDGVADVITAFGNAVKSVLDGIAGIIDSVGNACLNAGTGFKRLAEGLQIIAELDGWGLAGSLTAAAAGIAAIAGACAGLGDAGSQMMNIGQGLTLIAQSAQMAGSGAQALTMLADSMSQIAGVAPQMIVIGSAMSALGEACIASAAGTSIMTSSLASLNAGLMLIEGRLTMANAGLMVMLEQVASLNMGELTLADNLILLQVAFNDLAAAGLGAAPAMAMFAQSVRAALEQVQSAADQAMAQMAARVASGGAMIASTFMQVGAQSAQGLAVGLTAALSAMTNCMTSLSACVQAGGTQIMAAFTTMAAQSYAAMVKGLTPILPYVKKLTNALLTTLRSATGPARTAGLAIGSAFADGISGAGSAVSGAASGLVNIATSNLSSSSAATQARNAGAYIAQGFAAGMESCNDRIQRAAAAMVAAAQQAVEAKAKIASPSKLFKGLGEYVGEGFVIGIDAWSSQAAAAAENLVAAPAIAGSALEAAGFGQISGNDDRIIEMHVHSHIGGREVAHETYRYTKAMLDSDEKLQTMRGGSR